MSTLIPRAAALAAAGLLAAAAPAAAKTVCGQFGDPDGRFFVLNKVKTKVGSYGHLSGYFITPAGTATPFSGHYAVFSASRILVTAIEGVHQTGFGPGFTVYNFEAFLTDDGSTSNRYAVRTDGNTETVQGVATTSTSFESCKNVPKFGATL